MGQDLLLQHHGLPTRLLVWSESFGIALYFALAEQPQRPAIWVLNPYTLNRATTGRHGVYEIDDLQSGYDSYFLQKTTNFPADILAIRPRRYVTRVATQLAGFTLHRDLAKPLEQLHPVAVRKFSIPQSAVDGARQFLTLAGI